MNRLLVLSSVLLLASCLTISPREDAASCTLSGSSLDNLTSIISSCTAITIQNLTVPSGQTLSLTNLISGTTITFQGNIIFSSQEWLGPLVFISGSNITIKGSSGNRLDGKGADYWDGKGTNGGKTKPRFIQLKLNHSTIENINIYNSPAHVFSINNCHNVIIQNVLIDDSAGDSAGGHNTDGFDVSESSSIHIKGSTVYNQDDCLAINSGTDIHFEDNFCQGGHGISVGSVGNRTSNVVNGVVVKNCQINNNENGIRVKTIYEATGSVSNVTYEDIVLSNITHFGITIRGDYTNAGSKGNATEGVPITGLTIRNVTGSVAANATRIFVLVKGASNWDWSGINFTGGISSGGCSGIPSGSGAAC